MDERTEELLLKEEKNRLRKERQKRRKYRLLLLLLLMGGTGVMLTTSTYAWFTANRNVAIQDLQVDVTASDGIQISADGSNWKSIVQTQDLIDAKYDSSLDGTAPNANQMPTELTPVSTIGAVTDKGFLDMYLGTLAVSEQEPNIGSYIVTATQIKDEAKRTAGEYIAFDLFFKVKNPTPLHLNVGSGVTDTKEKDIPGIQNAARIAFITEGNTTAGSAIADIQKMKTSASTTKPGTVYIWEPNFDVHTAAAVANAKDAYGVTTTQSGAKAIPYAGIKAEVPASKNYLRKDANAEKAEFSNVAMDLQTKEAYSTKQAIISLEAGITKVRVYLWIEGQDVDCEDTASGGNIKFTLSISSLAEGAGV